MENSEENRLDLTGSIASLNPESSLLPGANSGSSNFIEKFLIKITQNSYVIPGLCITILAALALFRPFTSGDTLDLIEGAKTANRCIGDGIWLNCRSIYSDSQSGGFRFPLLQFLPALPLAAWGLKNLWIVRALVFLNFISFLGLLAFFRKGLRAQSKQFQMLGVLVLLGSPLIYYGRNSFSEMLGAFVILGFTWACLESKNWKSILLFAILSAITKDTSFPFLFVLAVIAAKTTQVRIIALLGCSLGAIVNFSFNFFKFGSLFDEGLTRPIHLVQDLATQVKFAFALWLSPAGGFLFFWFSFVFVLVFVTYRQWNGKRRGVLLGIFAVLFGLTAGFSRWWSPFGWIALGPRLMLPWIPSIILIIFYYFPSSIEEIIFYVRKFQKSQVALSFFVWVAFLPPFIPVVHPGALAILLNPPQQCAGFHPAQDVAHYYACSDLVMWPKFAMPLLQLYLAVLPPEFLLAAILYFLLIFKMLHQIASSGIGRNRLS